MDKEITDKEMLLKLLKQANDKLYSMNNMLSRVSVEINASIEINNIMINAIKEGQDDAQKENQSKNS